MLTCSINSLGRNRRKIRNRIQGAAQEQAEGSPTPEQHFGFLGRTRQLFNRLGNTVQETDIITDDLWDELEELLLGADVGPSTTLWLIDRLRQRTETKTCVLVNRYNKRYVRN